MTENENSYPTPDELLPQSGPMNLIDEVVEHTADFTRCRFTVSSDHVLYRDGSVPAWFGIEFMGQCSFYHFLLNRHIEGKPGKNGLFLGARRIHLNESEFRTNTPYIVYSEYFGVNDRYFAAKSHIHPENDREKKVIHGRLNALLLDEDVSLLERHREQFD